MQYQGGAEPLPEALLWLLITGEVPTANQVEGVRQELAKRAAVPDYVTTMIKNFPKDLHPMSQFSAAVYVSYAEGWLKLTFYPVLHCKRTANLQVLTKRESRKQITGTAPLRIHWISLVFTPLFFCFTRPYPLYAAKLPTVASMIYQHTYKDGKFVPFNPELDWAANYARMLGFNNQQFDELLRLYLVIHSDHEGGNVSAHTTHLVGSALSDPYLSFSAGLNGLAGPLHGLANQEVLTWTLELKKKLGDKPVTNEQLSAAVWEVLNQGKVVPGFGHAVLRKTDPRYTCQREFALKHLPNDPLFKLISQIYEVVPGILTKQGKTKNPWPNVDAHSGVLLQYYGLKDHSYYTVLFGVSRALGVLSSLVWDRILALPLERPKSVTTEWIQQKFSSGKKDLSEEDE